MAEQFVMDSIIELPGTPVPPLQVVLTGQVADSSNRIDVHYHFGVHGGVRVCEATYAATINNPLFVTSLMISAATGYGVCIGTRYLWESYGIIQATYREVRNTVGEAKTPSERAYHVVSRLPGKVAQFRDLAGSVAKGCVPAAGAGAIKEWLGF